jgi:hypothetical protein
MTHLQGEPDLNPFLRSASIDARIDEDFEWLMSIRNMNIKLVVYLEHK